MRLDAYYATVSLGNTILCNIAPDTILARIPRRISYSDRMCLETYDATVVLRIATVVVGEYDLNK